MNKDERAETSKEFKEKYGRKRFSSATAGKSIVLDMLYRGYLRDEGMSGADLENASLYDRAAIQKKITCDRDAFMYQNYILLCDWICDAFKAAAFQRDNVKSMLYHLYDIAITASCGENLKDALGDQTGIDKQLFQLSINCIKPGEHFFWMTQTIRADTEYGLRYVNAYNELIALIGEIIEIPEFVFFQINMTNTNGLMTHLNGRLETLRKAICERKVEEQATDPTSLTQKEREAMLENFGEISPAPPIPKENIRAAKQEIKNTLHNSLGGWSSSFLALSRNYLMRG